MLMIWDDLFKQMLVEVASQLDLVLSTTRAGYTLTKDKKTIGFSTFVNREGKLKILMDPRLSRKPVDLGNYTMDDLKGKDSKVLRILIAKITEEIEELKN